MPNFLFSSTVIGVVITGAYSLIQFQKANSLKYITEERKKWRKEIRDIMKGIGKSKCEDIGELLVQLKARINAYGLYSEMDYSKDAHIWKLLANIEKNKIISPEIGESEETNAKSEEAYNENKELLLNFLSLLLKNDWDRSKFEIEGSKQFLLNNFLYIAAITLYATMLSTKINPDLKINNILLVSISIGNGLALAMMKYGPTALRKGLTKKQRQSTKKMETSSNKITELVFKLTKEEQEKTTCIKKGVYLFVPSILILLVAGYALINENFDVTYLLFILITIVLLPSTWVCYGNEIETFHRRQNYFFTIDQLLSGNRKIHPAEIDTFPGK